MCFVMTSCGLQLDAPSISGYGSRIGALRPSGNALYYVSKNPPSTVMTLPVM